MTISFTAWLGKLVRTGNLEVETADGVTHEFGDGSGPPLGVKLVDRAAELGTADGSGAGARRTLHGRSADRTRGTLYNALEMGAKNLSELRSAAWVKAWKRPASRSGTCISATTARATRTTSRITTTSNPAVRLFLDMDRQYSCAYFELPAIPSNRRNTRKSATSPPSSSRGRAHTCSTSAADSAAWRSISRKWPAPA